MKKVKSEIKLVGVIVPIYNEAVIIEKFHKELIETLNSLPYKYIVYYVNDGSTDNTMEILKFIAESDQRIEIITLTRNFGHQSALTAGLDLAQGDILITLDGDGQHPVKLIPELINLYIAGYDIVQTQREDAKSISLKNISSNMFYWLISKISNTKIKPGTADFRLMSRHTVDTIKSLPEYHRFLRGLIPWTGYSVVIVPYHPCDRIGGHSKYTLKKMLSLASDAIFSFSTTPIKFTVIMGICFLFLAFCEIFYSLYFWFSDQYYKIQPGWTSLMLAILLGNAIILISLGVIGIYIGYVFQQVKGRPNYIVKAIIKNESEKT